MNLVNYFLTKLANIKELRKRLDDYDWAEVFGCAGEPGMNNYVMPVPVQIPEEVRPSKFIFSEVSTAPFTRDDVVEIIGMDDGENDGMDWLIAGKLRDGRYFMITAGCDYTGWD